MVYVQYMVYVSDNGVSLTRREAEIVYLTSVGKNRSNPRGEEYVDEPPWGREFADIGSLSLLLL